MKIKDKKVVREKYLNKLYEETGSITKNLVSLFDITALLNLDKHEGYNAAHSLHDLGLAKIRTKDGLIQLTPQGILQVEKSSLTEEGIKKTYCPTSKSEIPNFWSLLHPRVEKLTKERFDNRFHSDATLACLRDMNDLTKKFAIKNGSRERDGANLITNWPNSI